MTYGKTQRALAALAVVAAGGIAAFWVGFFTVGLAPEKPPACYFAYEHAFPLPDGLLAAVLFVAGVLVLRGRASGRSPMLVCSGALVFLGLLDAAFNFQQSVYRTSTADLVLNGCINLFCVVLGVLLAVYFRCEAPSASSTEALDCSVHGHD
jgi:hypothetical protein